MFKDKKGFTLIEMLAVIAIIAVLVAVIIPTVTSATTKAQAATDAANLRSVLGQMNTALLMDKTIAEVASEITPPESRLHPGAALHILYTTPGFIEVYYVDSGKYYGLDYLAEVAESGSSSLSTAKSATSGDWYAAGIGKVE